ncbi:hypothetical protein C7999DRAFT_16539 [Corynascus novoguineensis]|uniref:Uncharacterized protein n=1 Tax=Corynascus novoguineensis TaxID=1126955 RepID=A0AAN7CP39_9PEZI|nr:hypothetical protein C7999DRAFT_16539 [Corynascus novoguineensis]
MPGRRLRDSSTRKIPGRYREELGPSRADRLLFVHPNVPFNPALVEHCAYPSLPLDYPGMGPSEAEKARLAAHGAEKALSSGGLEEASEESEVSVVATGDQDGEPGASYSSSKNLGPRSLGSQRGQAPSSLNDLINSLTIKESATPAVAPLAATNPPEHPTRPAHVAKVPWRKSGQKLTENIEQTDKSGTQDRPNWADLSDSIKYAIIHDMTRTTPLSQAIQSLDLGHVEVSSLLGLIVEERKKKEKFAALLRQQQGSIEIPLAEELANLCPITEGITAEEVRRGRSFLKFLGVGRVAANLGFWEGTGANFHEVQIDEGCRALVDGFDLSAPGCEGEASSIHRLRSLKGAELLLRLDPPARTLNPQRLRSGASPNRTVRSRPNRMPPSAKFQSMKCTVGGRRYSDPDRSDWPVWKALWDAGVIPQTDLVVFTANSLVADEVMSLSSEEFDTINSTQPTESFGSKPADVHDYSVGHESDPYPRAPGTGYVNPFEDDYAVEVFADSPVRENEPIAEEPRHGSQTTTPAAPPISHNTFEVQVTQGAAIAKGSRREMEHVSTQPVTSQAPAPVHQPTPAEQTSHSEMDEARLALNRFLITPRPVVRQLHPELATGAVEMVSRVANVGSRVHFRDGILDLDMARQRARTVDVREEAFIDELDGPFGQTNYADSKSNRRRGRSTRKNNDDNDDDDTQWQKVWSESIQRKEACSLRNIPSAGPAAFTELGPQAKNSSSRKSLGDRNVENDAQVDPKPAKHRMYKPKFEGNGQSVKRARSKAVPELNENGQPIKRPRGRPPASRPGTGSGPGQSGPRRGPPAFSCEGDRLLRSTEGEVMTRAQLEEAYPHDQRIYRSGGNLGGGKFEIIATGVVWSFVPENEQQIPRRGLDHRSTKKSSKEGSKKADASVNTPTAAPADPAAHTQPVAEPRPPSSEKLTSQLVISPPIGKSKQTKFRIVRRNATPAQTTPPTLPAVTPGTATVSMTPSTASAPTTSMALSRAHRLRATPRASRNTAHGSGVIPTAAAPATDPRQRAARVRELDERCARYHVATRDRFDSDAAFLEHAESMLPLLYPNLSGRRGCGSGGSNGSPPLPPSREPSRLFI